MGISVHTQKKHYTNIGLRIPSPLLGVENGSGESDLILRDLLPSRVSHPYAEAGRQQQRGDEGERCDHARRRALEEPPFQRRQRAEQRQLSAYTTQSNSTKH